MKIFLFCLLLFSFFEACQPAPGAAATAAKEGTPGEHETENEVSLRKDAKWQADANTTKNVSRLQQTAAALNKRNLETAAHFQQAGNELQMGIDQLVKECRMKGADHDALHLWLEPLMKEVKHLKNVSATDTADMLFYSIRTRLLDYNLYFE